MAGNFEDDDRGRERSVVANESKIFISGEISDLDKIRKNLPRRNCRRSNQSRNCVPCLEISADKGRKRERERGTKFRLGSLFHFDAHMRTLLALHMLKWHG